MECRRSGRRPAVSLHGWTGVGVLRRQAVLKDTEELMARGQVRAPSAVWFLSQCVPSEPF